MTTMSSVTIDRLIASWDDQQAAYITHREQRFAVMVDVIAQLCSTTDKFGSDGTGLTVLDLACGPGSLSGRILETLPGVRVIGIDYDPVLLTLASAWLGARHGDRFTAVDGDLAAPSWFELLPTVPIHVAVSSTALHWLAPADLVAVYLQLGRILQPGGIVMNADHLRYDSRHQTFLSKLAAADDERTQRIAHAGGVPTWDQWWADAATEPLLRRHLDDRQRRFADRPPTEAAPLGLHLQALVTAGFSETGCLWRYYDDVVLFARR
jgi:SAM-dependent methyltransferase